MDLVRVSSKLLTLFKRKEDNKMQKIQEQLEAAGYQNAIAIATEAEIAAGAACGMLAMIVED